MSISRVASMLQNQSNPPQNAAVSTPLYFAGCPSSLQKVIWGFHSSNWIVPQIGLILVRKP